MSVGGGNVVVQGVHYESLMTSKAIFIDKDGTLLRNVPFNVDPDHVELMPGAIEALRRLEADGFQLILISNQPGVAFGYFEETALRFLRTHLTVLLANHGVHLNDFYWCPHHPKGKLLPYRANCLCRKPKPGLLLRAAREHSVQISDSWILGDILDDVEAGHRAGCRAILIDGGLETEWSLTPLRKPDYIVTHLEEAARLILAPALVKI